MSKVPKPNLFIVGVPKAGTTSLAINLVSTGDVYLPNTKESNYFIDNAFSHAVNIKSSDEYHKLYSVTKEYAYLCDASTSYIFDSQVAKKLKAYNPKSKIIILLRDPVERAYSHYNMEKNVYRREKLEFKDAMNLENRHDYFGYHINPYIEPSLYYTQVKTYVETFDKTNLKIIVLENTSNLNEEVEGFLGIKNISNNRYNENKEVRNKLFSFLINSQVLKNIRKILPNQIKQYLSEHLLFKKVEKIQLDIDLKRSLYTKYFKHDIEKLEKLLDTDLSKWKY